MRVANVIFSILEKLKCSDIFLITGGFAMHLNDATFLNKSFKVTCMHHEQALGYAALGYGKLCGKPAIVEVTSGCAAVNCLTPLADAWQDNVPIIFISGNTQSKNTIRYNRLHKNYISRHIAGADVDIVEMVKNITKYAEEIYDENNVIKNVITAYFECVSGRPGPVWLSIPLDIQSKDIEFNDEIFDREIQLFQNSIIPRKEISLKRDFSRFERPLILVGQGVRISNTISSFKKFIEKWQIPFVTTFLSVDILPDSHPLYQGRIGVVGERCGNFTVNNCDLLIVLGSRLASSVTGYNPQTFSRDSYRVVVDIDENEHSKEGITINEFIHMDLRDFFENEELMFSENDKRGKWLDKCQRWRGKWLFDEPFLVENDENGINPYFVMRRLSSYSPSNTIFTHSAGSLVTCTWHRLEMKGQRRFLNSASGGDMGQELPGSIGAYFANLRDENEKAKVCCLTGDGSFQFNIQELQTIFHHQIPMVVIVLNNNGYSAIKITQKAYFGNMIGVDADSGISFPEIKRISDAYKIKYFYIEKNSELNQETIENFFSLNEPCIVEIKVCDQERHPKLSAQKMPDGSFQSQPFENMAPFLEKEEFLSEMITKPL